MVLDRSKQIKAYILKNVQAHPSDIVKRVIEHFSVTATTVHRHINFLVKTNKIVKSGNTRNAKYFLQDDLKRQKTYDLNKITIKEDQIFTEFSEIFNRFPKNIYDICIFAVTEMLNNVLDHSKGTKVTLQTDYNEPNLVIVIQDNGVGLLKTICDYLQVADMREAMLHLVKGKITRDPANHTGQGIFFSSRMFDQFVIEANGYIYTRDNFLQDWSFKTSYGTKGTTIRMIINVNSNITCRDVFSAYEDNEHSFTKTEILVHLSDYNEDMFISRSQAKRILFGLEKFEQITFDFKKVTSVGQGFADEVFRVFANRHPNIKIYYINANEDVQYMIKRAIPSGRA